MVVLDLITILDLEPFDRPALS